MSRDLAVLCARINEAAPRLPDGYHLYFAISASAICHPLPVQENLGM